jgi:rRNA-processing protein FCF1
MQPDDLLEIIRKYQNKGILVDTNLLLLYFLGKVAPDQIERFKRTSDRYTRNDYDLLAAFLRHFSVIATTPNVLTEVSNLSGQLTGGVRDRCFHEFAKQIVQLDETYVPSTSVRKRPYFARFGLTDCAIVNLAKGLYLVLTDDAELSALLMREGVDVINFNRVRFADLV